MRRGSSDNWAGIGSVSGRVGGFWPPERCRQEAADGSRKRKVKSKTVPEFPALAKQMNVTGKVKIEATISPDGHVTTTKVVGGSPLLVNAAIDALKKMALRTGRQRNHRNHRV